MQDLEIIIKLDPIRDGIKDFFNVGKIEDRRGLLISTTGKYRTIDGDELEAIINQFDENGLTVVIGDYLGCLNRTKTFSVAGTSYLIGTVVVFKCKGHGTPVAVLSDDDIDRMRKEFDSRLVKVKIEGQTVLALEVD